MKNIFNKYSILIFVFFIVISSCKNNKKELELELLYEYLSANNIEEEPTESGLYFLESGFSTPETFNGSYPAVGDSVILIYKGYLLSDETIVFDEKTIIEPGVYIYKVENVIPAWEEIIGYMKIGTSAKVIIPSNLAYDNKQAGVIPPYSTLIFEIRILDIRQ